MGYYIFFDESGKIDRQKGTYSYYGALGITKSEKNRVNQLIGENLGSRELHFQKFSLHNIDMYLSIMNELLDVGKFNIYLVENQKALNIADRLNLEASRLRELLYIKIPERLIYGVLRNLNEFYNIKIVIDKCDEYDKYEIEKKLTDQLNAQSVYRNKKYLIDDVKQKDSKEDICLQGIDVMLGVISFLVDKKYLSYREDLNENDYNYICNVVTPKERFIIENSYRAKGDQYKLNIKGNNEKLRELKCIYEKYKFYTQSSIQKSEFIYRLLNTSEKLEKFSKVEMFVWTDSETINIINIIDFVGQFILFKSQFDDYNKMLILNKYKEKDDIQFNEYEKILGYGRNSSQILRRYLFELKINLK